VRYKFSPTKSWCVVVGVTAARRPSITPPFFIDQGRHDYLIYDVSRLRYYAASFNYLSCVNFTLFRVLIIYDLY